LRSIQTSWERIEQTLKQHAPATFKALGRSATERQITLLERKIGRTLPADLAESPRIHNGTRDPYRLAMLSAAAMARPWGVLNQLRKDGHFEPGGCPITTTRKIKNDQRWNPA
jgi:cell wall assembly regulator SMI1